MDNPEPGSCSRMGHFSIGDDTGVAEYPSLIWQERTWTTETRYGLELRKSKTVVVEGIESGNTEENPKNKT